MYPRTSAGSLARWQEDSELEARISESAAKHFQSYKNNTSVEDLQELFGALATNHTFCQKLLESIWIDPRESGIELRKALTQHFAVESWEDARRDHAN